MAYSFQFEHFVAGVPDSSVFDLPAAVTCEYVDPASLNYGGSGAGMFAAHTSEDDVDLLTKFGAI